MNIGFVPIDNRPVCYNLAQQISKIDSSINLFLPPRELLGDLTKYADVEKIFDWFKTLPEMDSIVLSLDTVAYGGLISSRRCPDSFEKIKSRIEKLKEILKSKNAKIYAFSSIMRISNNNINEEEKKYWSDWGKKIFDYSYNNNKEGRESCISNVIPSEILDDYLATRKRNFEINKIYLDWQKGDFFETLVFTKDDCAEYGFNVQEARAIEALGGFTKTGADEIPLSLFARAISNKIKIAPIFTEPAYKHLISNYEDISIEDSVKGQIELSGCSLSEPEDADILLYVNNFIDRQGEIVMKTSTEAYRGAWVAPRKPFMIADVRFANGADNKFIEQLFKTQCDENFYGYSGWNTSANTLGSLICAAKIRFCAQKFQKIEFKKLQITRFLDDWAYQANCRQALIAPDITATKKLMKPFEEKIFEFTGKKFMADYKFPWSRLFEIEVDVELI